MHAPLHPCRAAIIDFLKDNQDKYIINKIEAFNYYPKDPTNPSDWRIFDKEIGGALLDLGVYLIQQSDEILNTLGSDFKTAFHKGENRVVKIKKTPEGVDLESRCTMNHKGIEIYWECKVNPGTDTLEEQIIWLTRKLDNSVSKLTLSKACHPADSIGVFLEHADGTIEKIVGADTKTSYAYQSDMCNSLLMQL